MMNWRKWRKIKVWPTRRWAESPFWLAVMGASVIVIAFCEGVLP